MTIHKFSAWIEEVGMVGNDCEVCLNGPIPTPAIFAFRTMNVAPHERYRLVGLKADSERSWFSLGWEAGIESINDDNAVPTSPNHWGLGGIMMYDKVRAWTVGFLSGRYASDNDFAAVGCVHSDPEEHTLTPLGKFIREVEFAGKFPSDSLADDEYARDLIEICMNRNKSVKQTIVMISGAIDADIVRVKTNHKFDPNPTVIRRPGDDTPYAAYIKGLDATVIGWFWTSLKSMVPQLAEVARKRRCEVIGCAHEDAIFMIIEMARKP